MIYFSILFSTLLLGQNKFDLAQLKSKLAPSSQTQDAMQAAERQYGGKALQARPMGDVNESKNRYQVKMLRNGKVSTVLIDLNR